jgi:hypothetical protein
MCPQVSINNFPIPIKQEVKYLGLHLDEKNYHDRRIQKLKEDN